MVVKLACLYKKVMQTSAISLNRHMNAVWVGRCVCVCMYYVYTPIYTGQFISPSGISDLCGTVAGMVTPKASMSIGGQTLQVSVLPYRCSICPPLVTMQMSILQNSKTHNAFLFPVHAMFRHDCLLAVKPASTPWRLVQKKNLERFSTYWYAPFCCVCLGCCAAEFGSSGGTYELPCICSTDRIFNLLPQVSPL